MKPHDELLERYHQAKAQRPDGLPPEPPAALHERIMQAAHTQTSTINSIAAYAYSITANRLKEHQNTIKKPIPTPDAANDSFWNIKAIASLAVMGLSALLWWQFEHGTPEEQEAAKSAKASPVAATPAPLPTPMPTPAAPPTAVIQHDARAQAPRAEKQSIAAAPAQAAQEEARQLAKPAAAPPAVAPTIAERARTQDMAAAPEVAGAEAAVTADAPAGSALAKSSAQSPASKRFSAEAQGTLSTPPVAAPAARAATAAMAAIPQTNPLLAALQARDATALRQALVQGTSPNARTPDGNPALTQAVIQRWAEGVRILLASGADRNAKNNKGHTAADVAFEMGSSDMTELLATPR